MTLGWKKFGGWAAGLLLAFTLCVLGACSQTPKPAAPHGPVAESPAPLPGGQACLRVFWTKDAGLMSRVSAGISAGKGFAPLVREALRQNPGRASDRLVCLDKSQLQPSLAKLAESLETGEVGGPVELQGGQALALATTDRHYKRARALAKRGDWGRAQEELDQDLKLNPDNVSSWWLLSLAKLRGGKPKEALAAADRGLAWRHQYTPLLNSRGAALSSLGRKDEAIGAYRLALEYEPGDPLTMNNLAWALAGQGRDLDQALALASEAVRLKPKRPEFWDTLGRVYQQKEDYAKAAAAYHHALKLGGDNPALEEKLLACLKKLEPMQVEGLLAAKKPSLAPKSARPLAKRPAPRADRAAKPAPAPAPQHSALAGPKLNLDGRTLAYPAPPGKHSPPGKAKAPVVPKPAVSAKQAKAAPSAKAPKPPPAKIRKDYFVQVGSFKAHSLALKSQKRWRRMGHGCQMDQLDMGRKGKWYRVLLGPYPTLNKASHAALNLRKKKLIKSYMLVGKKVE